MAKKKQQDVATKPIDRIRKAYRDRRRSIEVPEWDGLELFFSPLTTADVAAADDRMQDRDGKEPAKHRHERNIYLLIATAELEDGSPAFRLGDKAFLMTEAEYAVIQRLVGFLYSTSMSADSVEDAKGKSEATPGSTSG